MQNCQLEKVVSDPAKSLQAREVNLLWVERNNPLPFYRLEIHEPLHTLCCDIPMHVSAC